MRRCNPQLLTLLAVVAGLTVVSWLATNVHSFFFLGGSYAELHSLWLFTAICVACTLIYARQGVNRYGFLWLGGMLFVGGFFALVRLEELRLGQPSPSQIPRKLTVSVLQPPAHRLFGERTVQVRVISGVGHGNRILIVAGNTFHRAAFAVGDVLTVSGVYEKIGSYEHGARHAGIAVQFRVYQVAKQGVRGGLLGVSDRLRRRVQLVFAHHLPKREAALATGMLLGQSQQLSLRDKEAFQKTGLTHLVAASGTNVALLVALTFVFTALFKLPFLIRLCVALAAICLYVPLAGGGPSIQRAAISGALLLIASMTGRPLLRWYALAFAALLTVAYNPWTVNDLGWQLSFAAVIGIFLGAKPLRHALVKSLQLPRWCADPAAVTIAATGATMGLIAHAFGYISPVGVFANLLALPAVPIVMWSGVGLSLASVLLPLCAAPLAMVLRLHLQWVFAVADTCAALPFATLPVSLFQPEIMAVLLLSVLICLQKPQHYRFYIVVLLVAVSGCMFSSSLIAPKGPKGLRVSFLAIGQGDATLIQHGSKTVLVDVGPPDGPIIQELRRAGVKRIDLLVLTHPSADHEGAAQRVLSEFVVGKILDGGAVAEFPITTGLRKAYHFAALHRIQRIVPNAGMKIVVGPILLKVLWPKGEVSHRSAAVDANKRATVLYVQDESFSMLLPADAESSVTNELSLAHVDVLKIAHHGSADPGLPALLKRLRPRIAVIPVGLHNRYGHPAPSTVQALEAVPLVRRTDLDGTVRITP